MFPTVTWSSSVGVHLILNGQQLPTSGLNQHLSTQDFHIIPIIYTHIHEAKPKSEVNLFITSCTTIYNKCKVYYFST
jgi:hypothetical protein